NQFGHALREAGVQPEQRVMIALPDGPAFVAALFGTLKIGAVVVMVNPQLKPDAIDYFYGYTRARVIVAHRDSVDAFRAAARGAPTIFIVGRTSISRRGRYRRAAARGLWCVDLARSAGEPRRVELYHRWKGTFGVELLDGRWTAEMWHIFISKRPGQVRPRT